MKKILIIDNDADLLDLIKQVFMRQGFDVYLCTTGINAFEIIDNYHPDLILIDIRLGDRSGTTICKEIKKTNDIPILLFSADINKGKLFADCDADGFIEKPFDIHELISKIKLYLNITVPA